MKPLVEISIEHYESLLKYASETSPLYLRLKNAVKTDANTIAISVRSRPGKDASRSGKTLVCESICLLVVQGGRPTSQVLYVSSG